MQINPNYPMSNECTSFTLYASSASQMISNFGRQVFEFSGDSSNAIFQSNLQNLIAVMNGLKAKINAIESAIPPIN